jgi:hypothetical protein
MLEIIYKPTLIQRLRNGEHFDLFRAIVKHILTIGLKPAGILPIWSLFLQAFNKEDAIYKRAAKRTETSMIRTTHEKRKKSYMALKLLIDAAAYDGTAAAKEAAGVLLELLANYSAAYYAPMTEASALFVNFIQDLNRDIYADRIALITGAATAIHNLDLNNEEFMNLYEGRAFAGEEEKVKGTMQDARKMVDHQFSVLTGSINAFYRANEMQTPKDTEVSESLTTIITFINSYIGQYETILARRTGGGHSGSGKPSFPGDGDSGNTPDEPYVPDNPDDNIPEFAISEQATLGNSQLMPGFGTQMSLRASNATAFAAVLFPSAKNGMLRLKYVESDTYEDFPIADFLFDTDAVTPIGLLVDAPNLETSFIKPFQSTEPAEAEVIKNGRLLATLTGVQFPAVLMEG